MTYAQRLKDPRWQKKRLKILERDEWKCTHCAAEGKTLHVHHAYYEKWKNPWDYPDHALVTVCEPCHEKLELLKVRFGIHSAQSASECSLFYELLCSKQSLQLLPTLAHWNDTLQKMRSSEAQQQDLAELESSTLDLIGLIMGILQSEQLKYHDIE